MTNLETELAHLVNLMAAPYRDNWKTYCWAKAVYLSESNATEYGNLPRLLKEAMLKSAAQPGAKTADLSSSATPSPARTDAV